MKDVPSDWEKPVAHICRGEKLRLRPYPEALCSCCPHSSDPQNRSIDLNIRSLTQAVEAILNGDVSSLEEYIVKQNKHEAFQDYIWNLGK